MGTHFTPPDLSRALHALFFVTIVLLVVGGFAFEHAVEVAEVALLDIEAFKPPAYGLRR